MDLNRVYWNKVHQFEYRKQSKGNIFLYNFEVKFASMVPGRGGHEISYICSSSKYNNLANLCNQCLIPAKYHNFHLSLPHEQKTDKLEEPDESELTDED